jgi:hypothetical protein
MNESSFHRNPALALLALMTYPVSGVQSSIIRYAKHGPMFRTQLWGQEMVMVCNMQLFKAIMARDTDIVNFNFMVSCFWIGMIHALLFSRSIRSDPTPV